jgi:ACR3 family arsenite transporter
VEECQSTRAIAATPVLLIAQLALLPLYLWLFVGSQFDLNLELGRHLLPAFVGLIVVPLILAFLTEKWAENSRKATGFIRFMGLMPVLLLTVVLFIITMTQVSQIDSAGPLIWPLMILFPTYLLAAALVGKALRLVFRLPMETGRTVIFSLHGFTFGTFNTRGLGYGRRGDCRPVFGGTVWNDALSAVGAWSAATGHLKNLTPIELI